MKRIPIITISTIMSLVLLACTANTGGDGMNGDAADDLNEVTGDNVIGMTVLDLSNPFFVQLTETVREEAEKHGYEVVVHDPRDDVNEQIGALENFIGQNVDAIVVTATDQNVIDEVVGSAAEQDIPVIAHTTKLENATAWVGADEYTMGFALGEQAGEWIQEVHGGEGEVGILNFDQIEQVVQRKEGIIDGIHEHSPEVDIVGDQQAGDPNSGLEVTEGFIQANPDLIGVFGINDGGALGAYSAAEGAGKDPETFAVGGIDAVPEAIDAINAGGIYKFTVDQQPVLTGETIVDVLLKIMNDESYDTENEIPVQGVNQSNIDE